MLMLFILLSALAGCSPVSASAQMPGVSFSPTVIDFGRIPSHEQPTQLLTAIFDRSAFASDHLPSLRVQGANGPVVTLFSRSVTTNTITLVYRIRVLDDGQYGPFQYHLVLIKDGSSRAGDAALKYVVDSGVAVQGEIVQGLEGSSETIDFGAVRYGKAALKWFTVGFYHSNFISESELSGRASENKDSPLPKSLQGMTVTSTSPYFTGIRKREFGLDASAWDVWQIVLSPNAPQKMLKATLTFQTGDGYFLTVPVTADLSGPGYPIPRWEPGKRKKH
jgi:hypothetical protein